MQFIRTEYSFRDTFYPLEKAVEDCAAYGYSHACIIDDTTFGYIKFEKACLEHNVKPIYGLSVIMTDKSVKDRSKYKTCDVSERVILIAKDQAGVQSLYALYKKSMDRYNRFPRLLPADLFGTDLIVIGNKFPHDINRREICVHTASYPKPEDKVIYQLITGDRGTPSIPGHFMPEYELEEYFPISSLAKRYEIEFSVGDFSLPKAKMIKYAGELDFEDECWAGLVRRGKLDQTSYCQRLEYEIKMIKSKNFQDYFMIVSEMIKDAKQSMIVGPGRGSSGGSLVCWVLGITEIDPLEHDLIFERFIDINRSDYPDIDTDYPDTRRADVIRSVRKKYKSVQKLATITQYSPRTIINDFAKEYDIPPWECDSLKNSIIERSSGDARAKACLEDTLQGEAGQEFLERFPHMGIIASAEGHARHHGTHAAGIIVLDEPLTNYGAVDNRSEIVCLEGGDAEGIGLLKIDCLGLRTLSVIENCLKLSGVPFDGIYSVPLDDAASLDVFNGSDLSDIFQFDGDAIGMVCGRITVKHFNDLVAITALGRPGALNSGGTDDYIRINEGEKDPVYYGEAYERITKHTNGVVVYQEQTMVLLREVGQLSWEDVNVMRKIISKSRGDEFFAKYKEKFIVGALDQGYTEAEAEIIWDAIASMGSYAFNKSHAVAYAMISYWCAWCKTRYPLNFLAANLNNAKDEDHALKLLRKYVATHNIRYVTVDPDISQAGWTIQDGKLIGGLMNIKGIGEKKAQDIIDRRDGKSKRPMTKTMIKMLMNPVTPFDVLYPINTLYAHIYANYNVIHIDEIEPKKTVTVIGKLTVKDLRDRNDVQSVIKRGGERVTENTHYLNLVIEDDSGVIKGTIAPFDMDRLDGMRLAETLAINDVIALNGYVREGWSTLSIKGVKNVKDISTM